MPPAYAVVLADVIGLPNNDVISLRISCDKNWVHVAISFSNNLRRPTDLLQRLRRGALGRAMDGVAWNVVVGQLGVWFDGRHQLGWLVTESALPAELRTQLRVGIRYVERRRHGPLCSNNKRQNTR